MLEVFIAITGLLGLGWTIYNLPAFIMGIRCLRRRGHENAMHVLDEDRSPSFSIIVPMKNEVKVASRILESLLKLSYPQDKYEIIVIDDGSTDGTSAICKRYARNHPRRIKYLRNSISMGKPPALNYALRSAKGEIVGIFDADNVPARDALAKVVKYFKDPEVAGVQGLIRSINAEQNMVTKVVYYEGLLQYEVLWRGKDRLGLFVPLAGTCQFVRRELLLKVGGWSNDSLAEDTELSAHFMEQGYVTKFASDVCSWQENPCSFEGLMKQRLRWFRGCLDVGLRYGRLMKLRSRRSFDAEVFFFGPLVLAFSAVGNLFGVYSLFTSTSSVVLPTVVMQLASLLMWVTLFLAGTVLVYATKPRKIGNLKWLPFIYVYWSLQVFVALYALWQTVLRRPRKWHKTVRSGVVTRAIAG